MVTVTPFGQTPAGAEAHLFELSSGGTVVRVSDFGATLVGVIVPDAEGTRADVVLGFDTLERYAGSNPACYGCTIGPVANRTDRGEVPVDGEVWHLKPNEGPNNLHTDLDHGLHKRLWSAAVDKNACRVTFTCALSHGELGLPGERVFTAAYELADTGALTLTYRCETDRPTFANMTNHAYFNLAGHNAGSVADHVVRVHAARYLPVREDSVSAGEIADVSGTPFDLREGAPLAAGINAHDPLIERAHGFDHCLCVNGYAEDAAPRPALEAWDPASGRTMEVRITAPGAHLYTGNWLGDADAKDGVSYGAHAGFAFEPEFYPDCAHHPTWPQPTCTPDHPYEAAIVYRFGTK